MNISVRLARLAACLCTAAIASLPSAVRADTTSRFCINKGLLAIEKVPATGQGRHLSVFRYGGMERLPQAPLLLAVKELERLDNMRCLTDAVEILDIDRSEIHSVGIGSKELRYRGARMKGEREPFKTDEFPYGTIRRGTSEKPGLTPLPAEYSGYSYELSVVDEDFRKDGCRHLISVMAIIEKEKGSGRVLGKVQVDHSEQQTECAEGK